MNNEYGCKEHNRLISVVVPLFNEEGNVQLLSDRLFNVLNNISYPYEVILVDDGSDDKSWDKIRGIADSYTQFKGLKLARNFGHQAALLAGLAHSKGHAVISLDGDLQHPPELIPELISEWENGSAVVETQRHYNAETSTFKKLTSYWFYRFFSAISDVDLQPGKSDFRLLDRKALDMLLDFQQSDLFLRGVVGWLDMPSSTIEFNAENRHSGVSKFNFKKMLKFAGTGVLAFSTKPLHIGINIGLITSAISFLYLVYIVIQFFLGNTVPGWASSLGLLSLLFGVLFVMLGIVGSYLGRIYVILQHRPPFIVFDETSKK